ncbi:MAG: DUF5053 domain-containing protein [Prevotellaceae bacterium]|jgi:phage gp29-like protein|nr:DUF5053 domain-containing protein [Prevotellaceae bacterium]
MEEITKVLEELKSVTGKTDARSEARKKELTQWIADNKAGHEKEIDAFMEIWLADMETENEEIKQVALREQISDKAYKLIPWSYIAKNYFGKSVSWLTQRVNGYPVRGKVYTLTDEQKDTLNRALSEIGTFIGSYRIA